MTIQDTIVEALKASQSAHSRALVTIASLRAEKGSLEAEVAKLNLQVASFRSQIAHLEQESVKIVEPTAVQSLIASLLQIVDEANLATSSSHAIQVAALTKRQTEADLSEQEQYSAGDETQPDPSTSSLNLRQLIRRELSTVGSNDGAR